MTFHLHIQIFALNKGLAVISMTYFGPSNQQPIWAKGGDVGRKLNRFNCWAEWPAVAVRSYWMWLNRKNAEEKKNTFSCHIELFRHHELMETRWVEFTESMSRFWWHTWIAWITLCVRSLIRTTNRWPAELIRIKWEFSVRLHKRFLVHVMSRFYLFSGENNVEPIPYPQTLWSG